jgi:flavin-dependent dehydrogenase
VRNGHEQTYREEVDRCDAVKARIDGAERTAGYFATRDYSYRSTEVAGDGWVLVGDAFGFLDPLYSSGVLLALRSGEMAADAIAEGLAAGDTSAAQLAKWGPGFNEGVDRMRRLVCEFYGGFSFGAFVRRYPELRGAVTDLLIGDLFTERVDRVWPAMESLYDGRAPIPGWKAGTSAGVDVDRAPQLTLPDGDRP